MSNRFNISFVNNWNGEFEIFINPDTHFRLPIGKK